MKPSTLIGLITTLKDKHGDHIDMREYGMTPFCIEAIQAQVAAVMPQLPRGAVAFDKRASKTWPIPGKHVLAIRESSKDVAPMTPWCFNHAYMTPAATWTDVFTACDLRDVIAWMPLPGDDA